MSFQSLPDRYMLEQNHPNPFNPETNIVYKLPKIEYVNLTIYNAMGQEIRNLVNSEQQAGVYTIRWSGRNDRGDRVSSGVYFYTIKAGEFVATRKALLMQ